MDKKNDNFILLSLSVFLLMIIGEVGITSNASADSMGNIGKITISAGDTPATPVIINQGPIKTEKSPAKIRTKKLNPYTGKPRQETALMAAAWEGEVETVLHLLKKSGTDINIQNHDGWTALAYAAIKGHEKITGVLLENGAFPNLGNDNGKTPLMAAVWNGHLTIVNILLEKGVSPNQKNNGGWTPMMYAAFKGHIDIALLLLKYGDIASADNTEGKAAIDLASCQDHVEFISILKSEW